MAPESTHRTSNGFLGFLGVTALLFGVVVIAVAVLAFSGKSGQTLEERRAAGRIEVRTRLENEAQEKLTSEGWIDKAKGLVHVSITDAIPMAVAELRSKKPAPSQVAVEPPLPVFVPDPKSTEPPPPALPSSPQGADTIRFTPPGAPAAATPAAPAATPAPAPAPATPAPVPAAAPAPAAPPAPAPAPAPVPAPPALEAKPVPPPAPPAPAPAAAPEAPARPPIINPTENPAPTK